MTKFRLGTVSGFVGVVALALYFVPDMYMQHKYASFYRQRDICFVLAVQGSADYRWWEASRCSTGETLEVLHGAPTAKLRFVDVDGDGIPEVYVSGKNPSYPGGNLHRFVDLGPNHVFNTVPEDEVDELMRRSRRW